MVHSTVSTSFSFCVFYHPLPVTSQTFGRLRLLPRDRHLLRLSHQKVLQSPETCGCGGPTSAHSPPFACVRLPSAPVTMQNPGPPTQILETLVGLAARDIRMMIGRLVIYARVENLSWKSKELIER